MPLFVFIMEIERFRDTCISLFPFSDLPIQPHEQLLLNNESGIFSKKGKSVALKCLCDRMYWLDRLHASKIKLSQEDVWEPNFKLIHSGRPYAFPKQWLIQFSLNWSIRKYSVGSRAKSLFIYFFFTRIKCTSGYELVELWNLYFRTQIFCKIHIKEADLFKNLLWSPLILQRYLPK